MTIDPHEYRRVMGRFPTGVTVLTTTNGADEHYAITVSSFTSVSLEPILVLTCIDHRARFWEPLRAAGVWGVSVLREDADDVSRYFATSGRPDTLDQFDRFKYSVGEQTGCVLLDDALATFEVSTEKFFEAGDHTVFLGTVLSIGTPQPDAEPLLYFRGRYRRLAGE